jgi:hypothetical protein
MSRSLRKIFKVYRSHVVTLPQEWVGKLKSDRVIILYDKVLLIVPEEDAGKVEDEIEKTIYNIAKGGKENERP